MVRSGTYVWSWGVGENQNFTLVIPRALPEPASAALLGMGCYRRDQRPRLRQCAGGSECRRPPNQSRTLSGQVPGEVLVHLEHGHLVLAEDALELVVGQDFTTVLRVLQVVGLDVLPHLAHHLAPGQRFWADHRRQRLGRLQRPL